MTTHEFAAEAHLTGSELDDDSAPLALGAERFRPVEADDAQSRRVRTLRQEHRMRTQIRALLYAGRRFQTTTISDLSRSGAGIDAASGVLTVRIHNIGNAPAPALVVKVTPRGAASAARAVTVTVEELAPPVDLRPSTRDVRISVALPAGTTGLAVELDPEERVHEICETNNRAVLSVQ